MNYPLISEYVEAIKAAEENFEQLNHLRPVLDEDGEPIMSSGNFALVFKMKDEQTGKLHAVKCFLKEQEGRAEAYRMISEELEYVNSTFLTPIKYLDKELFVDSKNSDESEFPVLLMDWVEGMTLDKYIREHIDDQYELSLLAYQFSRLAMWLMPQPFAHGDLKPDNILVKEDGTLVLVDYDGMYVPAMKGQSARELGSPDFRHPSRTEEVFDEHIDDFSLASILLSLKAIALQPSLLEEYGASDRLLFSEKDYRYLSESKVMDALKPLMQVTELASLYSLYILALSQNNLSQVSFRLFSLSRPKKSQYEEENLSTEVTEDDLAKGKEVVLLGGGIYSPDNCRFLLAPKNVSIFSVGEGVKVIGDCAFNRNYSLQEINLPDGIQVIGVAAFSHCHALIRISLPQSLITIRHSAFSSCKSLTSITIPNSVKEIEGQPFSWCDSLSTIIVDKDNAKYDSRNNCNAIIETISNALIQGCSKTIIPNGVSIINEHAFMGCRNLTSITIPESVTAIGDNAFYGCWNLKSINIPDKVNIIGKDSFHGCHSLEMVHIPESVNNIGRGAFVDCWNLKSIIIPNSVSRVEDYAFYGCRSLTSVKILNSETNFGECVFFYCRSLIKIFIPIGCKRKFEAMLPDYKDRLVEQDEEENLSTEVTEEDLANAWTDKYGVKYSADRKRLLKAPIGLHDYTIITGTKVICNWAFCEFVGGGKKKTYHGIHSITIPDSIVQVGEHAFICCDHLRYIYIPVLTRKKFEKIMPYCNMFVELLDLKNKDGWRILERRPFSRSEIETTSRAEVIDSQFGNSVGFFPYSGGFFHIPLVKYSSLAIGDIVDLSRANIVTLTKKGDGNIMRVEAFK